MEGEMEAYLLSVPRSHGSSRGWLVHNVLVF